MNIDKLMHDIKAVEAGRYDCSLKDISDICDAVGGGPLETGANCFRLGYIQGQKAEKAAAKKRELEARRREMKREAPGYGLLMALCERNRSNERYVRMLCTRAKILEDVLKEHAQTQAATGPGKDVHHDGE